MGVLNFSANTSCNVIMGYFAIQVTLVFHEKFQCFHFWSPESVRCVDGVRCFGQSPKKSGFLSFYLETVGLCWIRQPDYSKDDHCGESQPSHQCREHLHIYKCLSCKNVCHEHLHVYFAKMCVLA